MPRSIRESLESQPLSGLVLHISLNDSNFGNAYIAGGGGDDEIFGQLGNDVIQGDGSIDITNFNRSCRTSCWRVGWTTPALSLAAWLAPTTSTSAISSAPGATI